MTSITSEARLPARAHAGGDRRIPLVRVSGDHRSVGRQLGAATAPAVRRALDFDAILPAGRSLADQLALAARYRAATLAATPWLVEEIDGVAEGARVDPLELFAATVEEIWSAGPSVGGAVGLRPGDRIVQRAGRIGRAVGGGCSDLVVGPPLTADGHTWVAHNNDLPAQSRQDVTAIEWRVPGEPVVFSLGIGPWVSVGWNDAGLSLTGNELTPNDERVGIPRLLMVREQLTASTLEAAVRMALRPDRASSYNTMLAHREGGVVDVEGSATDAELMGLDERGVLAHTNHYVCGRMLGYEGDPVYALGSATRYERALELADAAEPGTIDLAWLRAALADHASRPAICRHGPGVDGTAAGASETVFWCIVDVTEGIVRYGLGNPCQPGEECYRFD